MSARTFAAIAITAILVVVGAPSAAIAAPAAPAESFVTCAEKGRDADRYCYEGDDVTGVVKEFSRGEVVYRQCARK